LSLYIKVKKTHPDAVIPRQKVGDVGWDLTAVEDGTIQPGKVAVAPTGLILAENPFANDIHSQILLKIEGRSGLASKHCVFPVGGIIDPSYRGEMGVMLYNGGDTPYEFKKGDRVAQIVVYEVHAKTMSNKTCFMEADTVRTSERGSKGFGSSGR
jgi:dUTP pyrophosphatase